MIDFLRGDVAHVESDYIVIEVNGIGYRVFTPNPYLFSIKDEKVVVYIHYHVRDDATLLYGFYTRNEQTLFRKLLDVTGIGPRVALGILSAGKPEQVVQAIQQENIAFLTKLPGIGKKTAQRIILDLKDKLGALVTEDSLLYSDGLMALPMDDLAEAGDENWQAAREGLIALGYTTAELDRAYVSLQQQMTGDESIDVLMKKALQQLFKG
ncbi:Holliday junction branch migration protein RuvA [Paenibacillus yanchengensis]|uniref:Holliday junction branch migration complex subunit RuvA n=1 Tax=Paenibacillus yanchengensis TaxID=2035833 RepID=A0ABW4YLA4_9BACL